MSDTNRTEIDELKALRAELFSEYEEKSDDVSNTEEAILLRQELLDEYSYAADNSSQIGSDYEDDESESSEAPVKTLTEGRNL